MKHARVLLPVFVFALLAVAGTVWLVRVARDGPAASAQLVEASDAPAPGASPGITTVSPVPTVVTSVPTGLASVPTVGAPSIPAHSAGHTTEAVRSTPATTRPPTAGPPPIPVRAIRVGGVTLDDTSPRTMCYLVRNLDSPVTVRITALSVSSPDVVISPDRCTGVSAQGPDWTPTFACKAGVDLKPRGDGCWTGIEPRTTPSADSEELHSSISIALRARCMSTTGLPCSDSGSPAPTAARPVDVTWTQTYAFQLCIRNPPGDNPFC